MSTKTNAFACLSTLVVVAATGTAQIELIANGGFETGDTSGWIYLPTGASSFAADAGSAFAGGFGGMLDNSTEASAAVIKQEGIGAGVVTGGQEITISFWAKGVNGVGGVNFAELFSHDAGGGVTSSQILGGAPLFVTEQWQQYNFTAFAAGNVEGGLSLLLNATTGAVVGSTSQLQIDNISVSVIPTPASAALLGFGGLVAVRRRR